MGGMIPTMSRIHTIPHLRKHSESAGSSSILPRVQVFATGKHRDKSYTPRDLDDMVENFNRFSTGPKALLRVPAVTGHEEQDEQELLNNSGIPALAWGTKLVREGNHLYLDFEDMPAKVADLIRARRYRKVSAEVYDTPPNGIPGKGKMLRRVAFLGGDIPQIKSLDDIPMPEVHSERSPRSRFAPGVRGMRLSGPLKVTSIRQRPHGLWQVFSEVQPMDRQAMLDMLGKHGVDVSGITDAVPDQVLADLLRVLEGTEHAAENPPPEQVAPEPQPGEESGTPAGKPGMGGDPTMMGDGPEDWPEPKDDAEKAAYRERCKKYMEHARKMSAKYGEDADDAEAIEDTDTTPSMMKDKGLPMKMSEVKALVARAVKDALATQAKGSLGELQKFAEETRAAERKRAVESVIDRLGREGKLAPSERSAVHARLLRADARTVVSKFSEAGKTVEATEFDLQVRELERRATRFGEQFKAPVSTENEGGEKETVQKFAEMNTRAFELAGTSPKDFVSTWEKASSDEKARTLEEARRFLGGR